MNNLKTFLPANYRTDLNDVDWKESVVMFGCSMAYGEGLDVKETISHHIEKILNVPVINMGVVGASNMFSFYNQLVLHKNYPRPKGIINLWTEYSRTSYFKSDSVVGYGSWNINENDYGDWWNRDITHSQTQTLMIQYSTQCLWDPIPHYEATFFKPTKELLGCDQLIGHMNESDYAKDGIHPGPSATKACAEYICSRFNFS